MEKQIFILAVCIVLLPAVTYAAPGQAQYNRGLTAWCDIPTVQTGEPAILTCHFSNDVAKFREDVQVIHTSMDGQETVILTCLWDDTSRDCMINLHYVFDGNVNDTLRIKIPRATQYYAGRYACTPLTIEAGNYEDCALNIADSAKRNGFGDIFDENRMPFIIGGATLCVLTVIAAITVTIALYKRRKEKSVKKYVEDAKQVLIEESKETNNTRSI